MARVDSKGGHHEIEAAKKRLATAKATASSASTMMDSARSMAATAKKNEAIAKSLLNNSSKEVEEANKLLKEVEKKWKVDVDVDDDDVHDSPKMNDSKKRSIVSATNTQASNSNENENNARADSNNNNSMRKYGPPPPPPPGDDAIVGSTSPQKRATIIVSEHQRSIQLHLTLLQHVATCNSTTCPSAYCTKMKDQLKHGTQCTVTATGGCNVCKRIRALLKAQQCPIPNCMAIREGVRQWWKKQQQAMAAECDIIPISITIEIFSYLDQESLMNLSLVSKQSHDIICNEPGNENKIIPVFEVSGSSTRRLLQILRDNFFDEAIKNKVQSYPHMKLTKLHYSNRMFDHDHEVERMTRDVRMDWITSLEMIPNSKIRHGYGRFPLYILSKILPKLRELDLSKSGRILTELSKNFPLLEKVTANNLTCFTSSGFDMRFCDNLKEIYMDHSSFEYIGSEHEDDISDLNNHPEIFMFYCCCKALERVSVRNMIGYDDHDDDEVLTQNILIKFVRNAPPSLHWFRSDLTPDNMAMLRIERPGIELLN